MHKKSIQYIIKYKLSLYMGIQFFLDGGKKMEYEISKGKGQIDTMLIGGVVVALVVGLGAGFLLFSGSGGAMDGEAMKETAPVLLSEEDKNFLVSIANSQVDLTTVRLASAIDWCTVNGGQWNFTQQQGQVQVDEATAQNLLGQGGDVVRTEEGVWLANVAVIARDTCIIPTQRPPAGTAPAPVPVAPPTPPAETADATETTEEEGA